MTIKSETRSKGSPARKGRLLDPASGGTDLGFGSVFDQLMVSAPVSCSRRVDEIVCVSVLFSRRRSFEGQRSGGLVPSPSMRPFISLSCSREDDRLAGKRLVRVLIAPGENVATFSPSFSLGRPLPWATTTSMESRLPRARRPRPRTCLNKECGRKYHPRRWNQRYCQHPECQREVNRWLAARRQAKRRQAVTAKTQHAQAEKERRQRAKSCPRLLRNRNLRRAWSRSKNFFSPLLMQSAGLLRTACDLTSQPGTLLLRRLPAGGSQCP